MIDFIPEVFGYFQVTAGYSNAVLIAILPYVSDFAKKMELPIPLPLTMAQVQQFGCDPHIGEVGGAVTLTNGYEIWFAQGYVQELRKPSSLFRRASLMTNLTGHAAPIADAWALGTSSVCRNQASMPEVDPVGRRKVPSGISDGLCSRSRQGSSSSCDPPA